MLGKSDFQCIFSNSRQQMHNRYLNNNPCKNLAPFSRMLCLLFLAFQVSRSNRKKYCWTALDTKIKQVRQKRNLKQAPQDEVKLFKALFPARQVMYFSLHIPLDLSSVNKQVTSCQSKWKAPHPSGLPPPLPRSKQCFISTYRIWICLFLTRTPFCSPAHQEDLQISPNTPPRPW